MAAATPVTATAPVKLEKKPVKFSNLLREPPVQSLALITTDGLRT